MKAKTDKPTKFVFARDKFQEILNPWYEYLIKARDSLKENKHPTLWDVSSSMVRMEGFTTAQCGEWADIAHEIKDYMGKESLMAVEIGFNL